MNFIITGAGIPYKVTVVAFTIAGRGVKNNSHIFFTEELIPNTSPENVMQERNGTTIHVSWDPLSLSEARGFPTYTVTLIPLSLVDNRATGQVNDDGVISVTTNESNIVIDGLDPAVEYSLTVSVGTNSGEISTAQSQLLKCIIYSHDIITMTRSETKLP